MRGFVLACVLLVGSSAAAQPPTPCASNQGVWVITTNSATLWVCTSDGLMWVVQERPWGGLTGTMSAQTDLQAALDAKQATLISATNIKTINGSTVLGSGDLVVGGGVAWGGITGTLSNQTDVQTALNGKQASGSYATGTGTANGTNTGDQTTVSGNAGTATALQNPRTINGVSFNGTANITVAADANTLTGTTLAPGVTASSLTSVGTVGTGTWNATAIADGKIAAALTGKSYAGSTAIMTGAITSSGGGVGYATGAGGTVTQATSKATTVVLSKLCGDITLNAAALAAAAIVSFTLTNTFVAAADLLVLNHVTTGTRGGYGLNAQAAAGSALIYVRNNTAGSLSEAIVVRFCVVKGALS